MRTLTASQVQALFAAMRTFRDDDLERGLPPDEAVACHECGRFRPAAGAIAYPDGLRCNGCATDHELLRAAGYR